MPSTERVVHRVLFGREVVGNRAGLAGAAVVVRDGGVAEQVDHAMEVILLADRQLERRDAGAELVLQVVERALKRRRAPGRAC